MDEQQQAVREVENLVSKATDIPDVTKKQLTEQLQKARTPLQWDRLIYRLVVGSLGLAILSCLTFSFLLVWRHTPVAGQADVKIPEIFMAIGSAAVGALAGLLAPSPK